MNRIDKGKYIHLCIFLYLSCFSKVYSITYTRNRPGVGPCYIESTSSRIISTQDPTVPVKVMLETLHSTTLGERKKKIRSVCESLVTERNPIKKFRLKKKFKILGEDFLDMTQTGCIETLTELVQANLLGDLCEEGNKFIVSHPQLINLLISKAKNLKGSVTSKLTCKSPKQFSRTRNMMNTIAPVLNRIAHELNCENKGERKVVTLNYEEVIKKCTYCSEALGKGRYKNAFKAKCDHEDEVLLVSNECITEKKLAGMVSKFDKSTVIHKQLKPEEKKYFVTPYSNLQTCSINKNCQQLCATQGLYSGTLEPFIKNKTPDDLKTCMALDIAKGVLALLKKGLYHSDLKPSNVFVNHQTGRAHIADLDGVSSAKRDHARKRLTTFTPPYVPPWVSNKIRYAPSKITIAERHAMDLYASSFMLDSLLFPDKNRNAPCKEEKSKDCLIDQLLMAFRNQDATKDIDTSKGNLRKLIRTIKNSPLKGPFKQPFKTGIKTVEAFCNKRLK